MKSWRSIRLRLVLLALTCLPTIVQADPLHARDVGHLRAITMDPGTNQPLPLTVVNNKLFCGRMRQAFGQYAASHGYDPAQQSRLAMAATVTVIEEFKLGRAADYVSTAILAESSRVPQRGEANVYLPLGSVLGMALGLGSNVTLALSAGELRFIPYAQKNVAVIVIANNAASLTPERSQRVADLARQAGIRINIVWVGNNDESGLAIEEARSLAWLASVTGGIFANLSGRENPCIAEA